MGEGRGQGEGGEARRFAVIGNPVAHSLSPVMHNALYAALAEKDERFASWRYEAVLCEDEMAARRQIAKVRDGEICGMNVTMPWKPVALAMADYVDAASDACGGANVLIASEGKLSAYNTDGEGAVGAIARASGVEARGKRVAVCGTGPTSLSIACAFAKARADEVVLFSREHARSRAAIERLRLSLPDDATRWMRAAEYGEAAGLVPSMEVFVDATPRGMHEGDEPIVDPSLFREGQVVLDTVYAHGVTKLVAGAREAGAFAMDGLGMLVEQAALSVEIWAEALGVPVEADRDVMREAAEDESARRARED